MQPSLKDPLPDGAALCLFFCLAFSAVILRSSVGVLESDCWLQIRMNKRHCHVYLQKFIARVAYLDIKSFFCHICCFFSIISSSNSKIWPSALLLGESPADLTATTGFLSFHPAFVTALCTAA
jgi:hypothetical protein